MVAVSSGFVLAQPEQHPVRGTWRWVPAPTQARPWGNPSADAQCGWTRTTGVVESHPEMYAWGLARGTWRWALTHVENRPWGNPSVGAQRGISGWSVSVNLVSLSQAFTESRPWGNPSIDAQCGWTRRTGVRVVSVSTWPAWVAPSQEILTLDASSHRESTMGVPIDRRSVRLHQVCRGRRYPHMGEPIRGGISMPSVHLERHSGVTRIVAPAKLLRLGVPSLLISNKT